jgi:hypothetical protein
MISPDDSIFLRGLCAGILSGTTRAILIGRRESNLQNKDKVDKLVSSIGFNTQLLTYDDLVSEIQGLISELK